MIEDEDSQHHVVAALGLEDYESDPSFVCFLPHDARCEGFLVFMEICPKGGDLRFHVSLGKEVSSMRSKMRPR